MTNEELDDAVCQRVLGWQRHPLGTYRRSARPSTELRDAMVIVAHLRTVPPEAWEVVMESNLGKWRVQFFDSFESFESGWHESLPRAICLSALMVVGVKVPA